MANTTDDDLFHDIIMGEEKCLANGFEAGYEAGQQSGYEEGYRLGWEQGSSIASEVGFYHGFTEQLHKKFKDDTSKTRAIKVIETLQKLISDFTIDDPTNPLLFEKLENIRAKFKQISVIQDTDRLSCSRRFLCIRKSCREQVVGRVFLLT